MNLIQAIQVVIGGSFGILTAIILFVKRYDILSFFNPNSYVLVEMMELDNSVSQWIQPKNNLKFEFNGGKYNLYHDGFNKDIKRLPAIYREGRLAKFFYYEGDSDPLDFRQQKISSNPQLNKQLESLEFSSIFDEDKTPIQSFIEKYLIWIVVGIIAIMVISSFKGG